MRFFTKVVYMYNENNKGPISQRLLNYTSIFNLFCVIVVKVISGANNSL